MRWVFWILHNNPAAQFEGTSISGVMVECVAAQQAAGLNGRFHGGELKIFFNKLACWLQSPFMLVFVFDGDEKPEIKRGTHVISKGLWWEELSKELITLCGYYWVQVFCNTPRAAVQFSDLSILRRLEKGRLSLAHSVNAI